MSYRLIDSNEIAIKYPEVNEMDCIYVDLPNGLDNEYHHIEAKPVKHGHWVLNERGVYQCECGFVPTMEEKIYYNYCPYCGARMMDERE